MILKHFEIVGDVIRTPKTVGELFAYKPQSFAWQKLGEVINFLHFNSGR